MRAYIEWIGIEGRKHALLHKVSRISCDPTSTIIVHADDEDGAKFVGVVHIDLTYEKED